MNKPRPGFCGQVKIKKVVDGDTLTVELTRRFNVRLIHENHDGKYFNSPEKNTIEGQKAKAFVETLVNDFPDEISLFIPAGEDQKLMDINSFNRILSEIWINDTRLTDILLEKGYGELK